jgi:cytochrome c553
MNKLLTSIITLAVSSVTAVSAFAQEVKGDAKAAEQKIAMCIGCHGIKGYQASFPEVYKVPMISGQNAKYIVNALNAYKKGERKHPTMRGIADSLSDQDIADVAAYYEQHGKTDAAVPAPAAADAKVDADGDGLKNPKDNCPFESNPDQIDLNKNGVGDACDGSREPKK